MGRRKGIYMFTVLHADELVLCGDSEENLNYDKTFIEK